MSFSILYPYVSRKYRSKTAPHISFAYVSFENLKLNFSALSIICVLQIQLLVNKSRHQCEKSRGRASSKCMRCKKVSCAIYTHKYTTVFCVSMQMCIPSVRPNIKTVHQTISLCQQLRCHKTLYVWS